MIKYYIFQEFTKAGACPNNKNEPFPSTEALVFYSVLGWILGGIVVAFMTIYP